ncbi:MAG: dTMP kinase [Desulfosoma sp.]|uniref:dTMP kinase n=1 Tax=Desulfosoma sp. TaxID=2603217 RepID=UPI00404AE86C
MMMHEAFTRGVFLSLEGLDGSGKTTLLSHVRRWIEELGYPVRVIREPGGTPLGERIRELLLDPGLAPMDPWSEVCLYVASQVQQAREVVMPCLKQGIWVLADRFRDATVAYQGWGRRLGAERVKDLQDLVLGSLFPHLTLLLDCDVAVAWNRVARRPGFRDRLEQETRHFMEKVRQGYLELARNHPQRFVVIDAAQPLPEVLQNVTAALERARPRLVSGDASEI